MAYARKKLPEEEARKLFKDGRKKFVTLEEGAALYSIGIHRFRDIAYDARDFYSHIRRSCRNCFRHWHFRGNNPNCQGCSEGIYC